jgi:lipopolysaccharide transport system ATP-binding protein
MKKAKARIGNLIDGARIMVLVSHDLTSVRDICNRAIWIDHGRVMDDGDPGSVVKAYLKSCEQPSAVQTTL